MKKYFTTILLICCITYVQAFQDANRDTLWNKIALDTFPFNFQYQEENKTAELMLMELGRHLQPHSEDYDFALKTVLVYQTLAGNDHIADSLIQIKSSIQSKKTNELIATKLYIQWLTCAQKYQDPNCIEKTKKLQDFLRNNYISEDVNEAMKWHWIAKMTSDSILIRHQNDFLKYSPQLSDADNTPQYKGAILSTQRNPSSTNILISDSYTQPIRFLELNKKGKWTDITSAAKLDNIPGGERLYSVDINNDGYHDLVILRNPSGSNSNYFYPSILINQKNGTYQDISLQAGLNIPQKSVCACFFDADKDGKMDIFLGNEGYNSLLFLQKDSLKFVESSNALGIATRPHRVVDCTIINNKYGVQNLLLSTYNYSNFLYEYQLINDQYPFYINKATDYQFDRPYKAGQILTGDFDGDGNINMILNVDQSKNDKETLSNVLSGSIDIEEYPIMKDLSFEQEESELHPLLTYLNSSINLDLGDAQPYLLYSGGRQWDELYPLMQFQHRKDHYFYQMYQLYQQPLFVNSMTITPHPKTLQPTIWMKGGYHNHLLKNKISTYEQNGENGKFIQIQLVGKQILDPIGATISVTTINSDGQETKRTRKIQVLDSQGKGAGQNLWLIPEGAKISEIKVIWPNYQIQILEKIDSKVTNITIHQEK